MKIDRVRKKTFLTSFKHRSQKSIVAELGEIVHDAVEFLETLRNESQGLPREFQDRLTDATTEVGTGLEFIEAMAELRPLLPRMQKGEITTTDVKVLRNLGRQARICIKGISDDWYGILKKPRTLGDPERIAAEMHGVIHNAFDLDEIGDSLEPWAKNATTPSNNVAEKQKLGRATITLYLNEVGDLRRKQESDGFCYAMGEKSARNAIVRFLAKNRGYQRTPDITTHLINKQGRRYDERAIREAIGKIRFNIKKHLKIEGVTVIDKGKKGSGYRINPNCTIKLVRP